LVGKSFADGRVVHRRADPAPDVLGDDLVGPRVGQDFGVAL
jgi:hypothetical protein